jgi:hypothetical protein
VISMAKKVWNFELDNIVHTVELEHGYWSGKRLLKVDGKIIEQTANVNDMFSDLGSEHAFEIDGHRCFVHIRPPGLSVDYDLVVDGSSLQVGKQIKRLEPQRSCFLAGFLILMMIANIGTSLFYLLESGQMQRVLPGFSAWMSIGLGLASLGNFIFAFAIWNWRKWGVYGYCIMVAVVFLAQLAAGLPWYVAGISLLFGALGVAIIMYLLQGLWQWMK